MTAVISFVICYKATNIAPKCVTVTEVIWHTHGGFLKYPAKRMSTFGRGGKGWKWVAKKSFSKEYFLYNIKMRALCSKSYFSCFSRLKSYSFGQNGHSWNVQNRFWAGDLKTRFLHYIWMVCHSLDYSVIHWIYSWLHPPNPY